MAVIFTATRDNWSQGENVETRFIVFLEKRFATMTYLHFIRPWCFWLFIPVLLIAMSYWYLRRNHSAWEKVCDVHLLNAILVTTDRVKNWWLWMVVIGLMLAVIALAGPSFKKQTVPLYQATNARVIVFDLSTNMLAQDIKPSRLVRARYKLIDLLKAIPDGQTGLVVFSGQPFVVTPLTKDTNTIVSQVPALTPDIMPVGGDNIATALEQAKSLITQAGNLRGQIILITASNPTQAAYREAAQLAKSGINVSVLGVGTLRGAPVPMANGSFAQQSGKIKLATLAVSKLQALANAGDGVYVTMGTGDQDIKTILTFAVDRHSKLSAAKTEQATSRWQDQGYYLVWLLLLIAAYAFRRGVVA